MFPLFSIFLTRFFLLISATATVAAAHINNKSRVTVVPYPCLFVSAYMCVFISESYIACPPCCSSCLVQKSTFGQLVDADTETGIVMLSFCAWQIECRAQRCVRVRGCS